jgi:hypothetical protein
MGHAFFIVFWGSRYSKKRKEVHLLLILEEGIEKGDLIYPLSSQYPGKKPSRANAEEAGKISLMRIF